ncbi:uncharacterized protein LOC126704218 [Quercus robur]|uniref:uncharacterized protein LOC126704218 n=1 Tax=Quercus robur TaxID=38942 RepID=UPI0021619F17|nr:uncharacterized protein LOC126704218 [Quercus robur]
MYSLCGSKSTNYYLKTRDARVRLISCLPDSNRNSAGEFVRVRGNWFAGEIPCPLTRREVDGKVFTQDLRAVHVKDLNFVLRSEIFVHWDGQLRASHLILGVEPVYSTWQSFKQALLVDSPLLSYIDVRYVNFLPPKLTTGEAREFGRRFTTADELVPLRDDSAEQVSRRLRERAHEAIQQGDQAQEQAHPEDPPAEHQQQVTDAANLLAEAIQPGASMVARRIMTLDRFVPGARPTNQPPPTQGRGLVSQPPPTSQSGRARKK